jgi:YesN/AraC family two-component response regulator
MHTRTGPNIKILIVDDDKVVADVLRDLISENGERTVDVCYDGLSAIETIQKNLYDLLIVDLVMPRVGGLDLLKYAKKVNPDTIVVIITGYASLETAIMAIKEGAYDYIRKPCNLEEIKIVVKNAIERITLHRENKDLVKKLQDAYHELMVLKEKRLEDAEAANINLFSPNVPSLHYLYNPDYPPDNYVEKLQALSTLKENGVLTDSEFKAFKKHLVGMISLRG